MCRQCLCQRYWLYATIVLCIHCKWVAHVNLLINGDNDDDDDSLYTTMRRSSVLAVIGTGLNTRRSPSVMRLVSTGWRCPGTVETPATCWWRHDMQIGDPTGWSSALQTATMMPREAAVPVMSVPGGFVGVHHLVSTLTALPTGRLVVRLQTSNPVACWWNSTKLQCVFCWLSIRTPVSQKWRCSKY